jgi:hypothetical protein
MRSKVTAVSYLQSGVIDIQPSQISAYKKQCIRSFVQEIRRRCDMHIAQRYHLHRCDMHSGIIDPRPAVICTLHSGVNDNAVTCTAVSLTPLCNQLCRISSRIRSYIRKGHVSGAQAKLFDERNQRSKISCQGSLKMPTGPTLKEKLIGL